MTLLDMGLGLACMLAGLFFADVATISRGCLTVLASIAKRTHTRSFTIRLFIACYDGPRHDPGKLEPTNGNSL